MCFFVVLKHSYGSEDCSSVSMENSFMEGGETEKNIDIKTSAFKKRTIFVLMDELDFKKKKSRMKSCL